MREFGSENFMPSSDPPLSDGGKQRRKTSTCCGRHISGAGRTDVCFYPREHPSTCEKCQTRRLCGGVDAGHGNRGKRGEGGGGARVTTGEKFAEGGSGNLFARTTTTGQSLPSPSVSTRWLLKYHSGSAPERDGLI